MTNQQRGSQGIPPVVHFLGLTIFTLTTSEFMVAGMMPSLTKAFGVTVGEIGFLISLYAVGMVVGGPILTACLLILKIPHKQALLGLLAIYAAATALAALATGYGAMAVARIVTGVASSACFGVSLAICANVVAPEARGRASSIVLSGLMLSTVLGVPLATIVDQHFGWRASFWLVAALTMLCSAIIIAMVPLSSEAGRVSLGTELAEFRKGRLWAAYATSGLIIGATFAAFSYFTPILTEVSGFSAAAVPPLLAVYGAANVVGNAIVGRFADKHAIPIMVGGLVGLAAAISVLAAFAQNQVICVAALIVIGLVGVPLNPAMVARVMTAAHPGPLVSTVHTSVINIGLGLGSWLGGLGISAGCGLRSPLWVGAILALLGLISLLPAGGKEATRRGRTPSLP